MRCKALKLKHLFESQDLLEYAKTAGQTNCLLALLAFKPSQDCMYILKKLSALERRLEGAVLQMLQPQGGGKRISNCKDCCQADTFLLAYMAEPELNPELSKVWLSLSTYLDLLPSNC